MSSRGGGGDFWQYIPRVVAYEPLRATPLKGPPVLLYREIVEHPMLTTAQVRKACGWILGAVWMECESLEGCYWVRWDLLGSVVA